jgi:hypothetical protein
MMQQLRKSACAVSLTVFMLLSLVVPQQLYAGDFFVDGILYNELTDNTCEVTTYSYTGDVNIPETVSYGGKKYTVTAIGNNAFSMSSDLTAVTIPTTVTSIGEHAFYACSKLTSVTIPDFVTSIGAYAFMNCSSLATVTIGNSITTIGVSAFQYCDELTSVIIPDSVITISEDAFYQCDNLKSVIVGNSVTTIGRYAFYSCDALKSITIGNSVNLIGESAFGYCNALERVDISDLSAWCKIDLYSNPNSYAHNLLVNGEEITDLTIPDDVTEIKPSVFCFCDKMTSVTIPSTVVSIGGSAFDTCSALTSVVFEDGASDLSLDMNAFFRCSIEKAYLGRQMDFLGLSGATLKTVEFGENVQSIVCVELPGYTSLKNVIVHSVFPPAFQGAYFADSTYQTATLFVPESAISNYQSAVGWENFLNVKSLDDYDAALNDVRIDSNATFSVCNGVLHIDGDANVRVVAVNGTVVYSGNDNRDIALNKGLYIVIVGDNASKIAVR